MKPARFSLLAIALSIALSIGLVAPTSAHQPVNLRASDADLASSQILVDGTVSWAVYADFKKADQTRNFRFALGKGDRLRVEYLILDRKPENSLKKRELPAVTITSPTGKNISLAVTERTSFYEPFGGKNYLFLSRLNKKGETGVYSVTIRSKRAGAVVIAIGSREVSGEVLQVSNGAATCPKSLGQGVEIPIAIARQLVGLSEAAAQLCASINLWSFRIAKRDGEDFPLTMDYRFDRVNVNIEEGKVVDLTVG